MQVSMKSLKQIAITVLISMSVSGLSASLAHADHTIPGQGTGLPGSIGGVGGQLDDVSAWCNNTVLILDQAEARAKAALFRGRYQQAAETLKAGLQQAAQSTGLLEGAQPLTAQAITRAFELETAIEGVLTPNLSGFRSATYFLLKQYAFIRDIKNRLDLPMYIPYLQCQGCGTVNMEEFEARYLEFAKRHVQDVLVTLAQADSRGFVTPVGQPRMFLKALEWTTLWASEDLRDSLWSSRYACGAFRFQDLSTRLRANAYIGQVDAVNGSYREAYDILNSLRLGGCGL